MQVVCLMCVTSEESNACRVFNETQFVCECVSVVRIPNHYRRSPLWSPLWPPLTPTESSVCGVFSVCERVRMFVCVRVCVVCECVCACVCACVLLRCV